VLGVFRGGVITTSIDIYGVKADFGRRRDKTLRLNVAEGSTVDVGDVLQRFDSVIVNASEGSRIVALPHPPVEPGPSTVLQPHCETNAFLTIGTRGWLFFKPTRLRLKSEVRYRIDGQPTVYSQVVSLNFDVRPPLRSVLIGAVAGAVLGGAARFVRDIPALSKTIFQFGVQDWITQGIQLGGYIVMSVISAIALSRKTGAQGFITVEDFFGGFVIGVLVAYEGPSYFENVLSHAASPSAAPATHQ
jgi:hypothetical protein